MTDQQQQELLPCPFCGGHAVMCDRDPMDRPFWVVCRPCDAAGPRDLTRIAAAAAWNRRASLAVQPAAVPAGGVPLLTAKMADWMLRAEVDNNRHFQFYEQERDALRAIASGAAVVVPARPVEGESRERFEVWFASEGQRKVALVRELKDGAWLIWQAALAQAQPPAPTDDALRRLLQEARYELQGTMDASFIAQPWRDKVNELLARIDAAIRESQPSKEPT